MKVNLLQTEELILIGSGGHAAVLAEIIFQQQPRSKIVAISTLDDTSERKIFDNIFILEEDKSILNYDIGTTFLVNGIGSIPGNTRRNMLYRKFTNNGFHFYSVLSPHAVISPFASLGSGVQVMAGAIIQHGAVIGDNCIINTGAIIEHDCVIGAHTHIAPSATLSGGVITEECVHVGTNATIIQNIHIGKTSIIGAGATITKDVENNTTVYPAKVFSRGP
ncbi:acetyltransferase [Pectobacterium odoriferum]|uniref:acetyltransferase n=1 Tax=Pectobacterium odoriferum TaxID=78398 RepID=UPI001CF34FB2|nr:acetyltransferase [Pectobacterium odoriferum]MCA6963426.1 acetyltransferase [Pectobacterium odoriferum]MCH5011513.1 acetyltransferase [Pectobacterium odoriferum]